MIEETQSIDHISNRKWREKEAYSFGKRQRGPWCELSRNVSSLVKRSEYKWREVEDDGAAQYLMV